jgi:hypothetical protein
VAFVAIPSTVLVALLISAAVPFAVAVSFVALAISFTPTGSHWSEDSSDLRVFDLNGNAGGVVEIRAYVGLIFAEITVFYVQRAACGVKDPAAESHAAGPAGPGRSGWSAGAMDASHAGRRSGGDARTAEAGPSGARRSGHPFHAAGSAGAAGPSAAIERAFGHESRLVNVERPSVVDSSPKTVASVAAGAAGATRAAITSIARIPAGAADATAREARRCVPAIAAIATIAAGATRAADSPRAAGASHRDVLVE